jgi:dephospho-CoA kinase
MRELAYSTPEARTALEAIVHPLVSLHSSQQAQAAEDAGTRVIVFDVPLLVESARGAAAGCGDRDRLPARFADSARDEPKWSEPEHCRGDFAAQSPRNIRRASADIVVDNGDNCTLADLQKMAEQVATRLGL